MFSDQHFVTVLCTISFVRDYSLIEEKMLVKFLLFVIYCSWQLRYYMRKFCVVHFALELCKIEVRHMLFKKIGFLIFLNNQITA